MRLLRGTILSLSALLLLGFCYCDVARTVAVVGVGECADCVQNNIKSNHAFTGLKVAIDCKAGNQGFKTRGVGELDKEGKFVVKLPDNLINEKGELKEECYAQLHSAENTPCPAHNGLGPSKIVYKSKENGKHTFGMAGKLTFSQATCTSAFLWPYYKKPLPPLIPIYKPFPKTFPPIYQKPLPPPIPIYKLPPVPIYKKPFYKKPFYKKPLPPPVPIYKKPLPPPVPIYKPPPVPIYKKPFYKKPLPPPVPIYKKPLPPPIPIYKPPPVPIYKKPFYKKPLPPPVPIYKPPPVPIYKKPFYKKPLPPPVYVPKFPPIYKKPLPPIPKFPPIYTKPLPPFPPIYVKPFPPMYKKPLPPLPPFPFPKYYKPKYPIFPPHKP